MLGRTTPQNDLPTYLGNEIKLLEVDAESCAWEPAMFQTAEICMQGFKGGEQAKGAAPQRCMLEADTGGDSI